MDSRKKLVIRLASLLDPVHAGLKSVVAGYIKGAVDTPGLVTMLREASKTYAELAAIVEKEYHHLGSGLT